MEHPPYPDKKGTIGHIKDIHGQVDSFAILDEIVRPQTNFSDKLLYLQKIQFNSDKRIEYRLAYYIIGKKPKMAGKWVFGQYATMMPAEDFKYLIDEASRRGWLA